MESDSTPLQQIYTPLFGSNFLEDHARNIINDPKIALIELIANSWDAGANRIDITWPEDSVPDIVEIRDDGIGMTSKEFTERWLELNYNRKETQGDSVIFPEGNTRSRRKAYGTNGKGRHAMFCFSDQYQVETWRDGQCNRFSVLRTRGVSTVPFKITLTDSFAKTGHGTSISTTLGRHYLTTDKAHDLIGSKFIADPSFLIYLNGALVELSNLQNYVIGSRQVFVPEVGDIQIHCVDSHKTGRTSKQHGVAWWVNKRLVGEPSWKGFDDEAYLDARTVEARRYTFVVEADILVDDVMEDWNGFKDTDSFVSVQSSVKLNIHKWLRELMKDVHKSQKMAVAVINRDSLKELPRDSRYHIGKFIDELQDRVTTVDGKVLSATVEVLSKLEKARSGYALLSQLAKLDSNDLDGLSSILEKWSVVEARIVLDELGRRLELIKSLENLVDNPSSDELHDIQPLFEKGLWMFGPEYESLQFISNSSLSSIMKKFFNDKEVRLETPKRRPDLIALPDSSIGVYALDDYDERGEVKGISKVLIVELKKGGFNLTRKEGRQAEDYATELRKSGKIDRTTQITAFVLGSTLSDDFREPFKEGEYTVIYPRSYTVVLRQAHARTFNLVKKIEEAKELELSDPEIEQALESPQQATMLS